jgi:hypothetical protein
MESSAYLSLVKEYALMAIALVAILLFLYCLVRCISLIVNRIYLHSRSMVWLELTPPASISKTPESTTQLFSVVHGFRTARTLKERLLRRTPALSFEIVSTKKQGIRFLVQVEARSANSIQKVIAAYIPEAKIKIVDNPAGKPDLIKEFTQKHHFVLPLAPSEAFEQHDPLSYITAAMTKLDDNESLTMQLVIQPIKLTEASRLSRRILSNEDILKRVSRGKLSPLSKVGELFSGAALGVTDTIGEVYNGSTSSYYQNKSSKDAALQTQVQKRQRPARTLSAFELELMESMHQKVSQPLFQVDLRLLVNSPDAKEQLATLRSALDGYSVPQYQSLRAKARLPLVQTYRTRLAALRLPNLMRKQSLVLSASEVSSLFHFPASNISKTDNLVTSLSRTLPAPVSLKSGQELSVLIGENIHHEVTTAIGLTEAERQRHMYVIGGTGNGKTTMLLYSIIQDIKSGKGLAVIDPHGDLAETILHHIPEDRIGDVIYMNPDDLAYPIGVNLLELTPGLEGDDLLREKDLITESTISVLRKIFSEDDSGGHRIEYVLRNTIQTALTMENPNLFTIFRLLNDNKYRREIVKTLDDEDLRNFWKNELGKAGDFQKVKMVAGITAKIGRFLFSASAKRILEQDKSTIDFGDILDSGKILICNFSKGALGEDTSSLFGTTILAKLQVASLRRARLKQADRRPFYLYVDEFQNFATMSFVQMLSEARKYKLFLIMAEQSTSQQDQQRLVDIILANVGTVICFRSGSPADERYVLPLFYPYIEQGEIANLPAYNFYMRIAAVTAQEPLSGQTLLLNEADDEAIFKEAIRSSREKYAKKVVAKEKTQKTITATLTKSKPVTKKRSKNGMRDRYKRPS